MPGTGLGKEASSNIPPTVKDCLMDGLMVNGVSRCLAQRFIYKGPFSRLKVIKAVPSVGTSHVWYCPAYLLGNSAASA